MKKVLIAVQKFLFVFLLISTFADNLFANSLDNLSPLSAKFYVNCARYASTDDSADIGAYNPAGIALMNPGFYLDVSGQEYLIFESQKVSDKNSGIDEKYKNDKILAAPVVPAIHFVYNAGDYGAGNLAFYLGVDFPATTGALDWRNGNAGQVVILNSIASQAAAFFLLTPKDQDVHVEGSSLYIGTNFSAACSFFDNRMAVSAGGRYIIAQQTVNISGKYYFDETDFSIDSSYDANARGFCPIIGADFRFIKDLNIAVSYEFETKLKYKYDVDKRSVKSSVSTYDSVAGAVEDNLPADNETYRRDLPRAIAFGAEYKFTPKFKGCVSSTVYFIKSAEINIPDKYFEKAGGNINLGGEYKLTENITLGASAAYTIIGLKNSFYENSETINQAANFYPVDRVILTSAGVIYKIPGTGVDLTAALSYLHFNTRGGSITDSTTGADSGVDVDYKKDIIMIAYGAGHKM